MSIPGSLHREGWENAVALAENGVPASLWDGKVKNLIYDSDLMTWIAQTAENSGGVNYSTAGNQTTQIARLDTIITHVDGLESLLTTLNANADSSHSTGAVSRPAITSTSSTILAANANRRYVCITNNGAATAYLQLGAAAVVGQGIALAVGARYEINMVNLWVGDIRGIAALGANLDVFEGTP